MKRSPGVTVIAILALLGSALTLLMGIVILVAMAFAPVPDSSQFPGSPMLFRVILAATSLMYFLPAIWGILAAIGLLRLKNWARISMIAFSILLIMMSGFAGLISAVVPIPATSSNDVDPSMIMAIRIGMAIFWFTQLGIGVWWLVFFTRSKVKAQFGQLAPVFAGGPLPPQSVYPVQTLPVTATEPKTSNRPVSITVIAWFLLVGPLFIPLSLVMHAPAVLFTNLLTGWQANLVFLAFAAAQILVGIGLRRLRPAARIAAIVLLSFGCLNSAVFFLAPGSHARIGTLIDSQQSMFPWMRLLQTQSELHFDPAPFLVIGGVLGLVVATVPLYFLVTRRRAFEMAAADLESKRTQL